MPKIIVSKKALIDKLSEVEDDSLIELVIVPAQYDRNIYHPAFLHIASISNEAVYCDLEFIDESPMIFR